MNAYYMSGTVPGSGDIIVIQKKIKEGSRGIEKQAGSWEVVASQVTREALTDKVTFVQRYEGPERVR